MSLPLLQMTQYEVRHTLKIGWLYAMLPLKKNKKNWCLHNENEGLSNAKLHSTFIDRNQSCLTDR